MSERKPQAAPKSPGPSRLKDSEFTLHGRNACLSAFAARPGDLLRMFFHSDRAREVSHIKKWCADHRLPYRKLEDADLRRVSGTVHHEGIVLVLRPPVLRSAYDLLDQGLGAGEFLVALDRVENTHNLGALLRTAAYFGAAGGLLSREPGQAGLAPSAARTAEGALERLPLYTCADLASLLRELKTRGVFILGASPDAADSLYAVSVPWPCAVVVGNEKTGLSAKVRGRCDALVKIPGAGPVESLNVAVALGVVLGELHRRHQDGSAGK